MCRLNGIVIYRIECHKKENVPLKDLFYPLRVDATIFFSSIQKAVREGKQFYFVESRKIRYHR